VQAAATRRGAGIVVWILAVETIPTPMWESLTALLDDGERARAARFVCERHRRARVAAHALRRLMLQEFAGAPAHSWRFETAPGGKPRVAGIGKPYFNIAYSAARVACGMSDEVDLGIDLEYAACPAPLALAGDYLTAGETRWLQRLPGPAQSDGFFRLWTLKEAFTKATGTGLLGDVQDIGFEFDPLRVRFRDESLGDPGSWHFDQRRIDDAFFLAIAWQDGPCDLAVTVEQVRLESLRSGAAGVASRTPQARMEADPP
jgi:4'-phosphopantetheinyl transferase